MTTQQRRCTELHCNGTLRLEPEPDSDGFVWVCRFCARTTEVPGTRLQAYVLETAAVRAAIRAEGPLPRGPKPRVRVAS